MKMKAVKVVKVVKDITTKGRIIKNQDKYKIIEISLQVTQVLNLPNKDLRTVPIIYLIVE